MTAYQKSNRKHAVMRGYYVMRNVLALLLLLGVSALAWAGPPSA
jgi:hypothetical protein